jgi:predicted membrane channel-forming protein YqfA (hemolysin III family)
VDDTNDNPITAPDSVALPSEPPAADPVAPADSALEVSPKRGALSFLAPAIAIIAWFIPGLGHLLLGRWGRALVFFFAVGGLAVSGYLMRGNVFPPHSQDPFGTLGFMADACSGVFYLLARVFEPAGPNVARAIGDYGTRFIAAAGLVNVLGICDAYEIASGRRR